MCDLYMDEDLKNEHLKVSDAFNELLDVQFI